MKKVLMGNHAAGVAVKLARVDVVSAYPITPQTQSVELLSEMEASGEFKGRFIKVESEHSAMASLVGASIGGARTFTSTSSHGLAYMHEVLHWAAGSRLPIVMAEINRGMGAPWVLWTDQTDSLSQRDTGWMQAYCTSNQDVLDMMLIAYLVAEEVSLPMMVVLDGFILSHTYEPVDIPDQKDVDRFLPKFKSDYSVDLKRPRTYGSLTLPKDYFRLRRRMAADMNRALEVFEEACEKFDGIFGRRYSAVETYLCDDADLVLVTSGAVSSTAIAAVDELRAEGFKAGNLRQRLFRPFPAEALRKAAKPGTPLVVVDRNISEGHHGIFCEEIKSALYSMKKPPPVYGVVTGLGGGDITVELLKEIWHEAKDGKIEASEMAFMEDAR